MPIHKKPHLRLKWSKRENDVMIDYPRSCDGHYVHYMLGCKRYDHDPITKTRKEENSFFEELDKRGYDLTTIKFSIQWKETK